MAVQSQLLVKWLLTIPGCWNFQLFLNQLGSTTLRGNCGGLQNGTRWTWARYWVLFLAGSSPPAYTLSINRLITGLERLLEMT
jgi:hypothetical protein